MIYNKVIVNEIHPRNNNYATTTSQQSLLFYKKCLTHPLAFPARPTTFYRYPRLPQTIVQSLWTPQNYPQITNQSVKKECISPMHSFFILLFLVRHHKSSNFFYLLLFCIKKYKDKCIGGETEFVTKKNSFYFTDVRDDNWDSINS